MHTHLCIYITNSNSVTAYQCRCARFRFFFSETSLSISLSFITTVHIYARRIVHLSKVADWGKASNYTMEKSEQFSDYLFAKMGPPSSTTVNGTELPPKTTERSGAPRELTGYRKWLRENLMLLVTLSGVLLGVIFGELKNSHNCLIYHYFTILLNFDRFSDFSGKFKPFKKKNFQIQKYE